jgi:hypothetical protein
MKPLIATLLVCLGLVEIFYGVFWGRMRIYAYEAPMVNALGLSPEKHKAFGDYVGIFKDQWKVVAVFGLVNILLVIAGVLLSKRRTMKG